MLPIFAKNASVRFLPHIEMSLVLQDPAPTPIKKNQNQIDYGQLHLFRFDFLLPQNYKNYGHSQLFYLLCGSDVLRFYY